MKQRSSGAFMHGWKSIWAGNFRRRLNSGTHIRVCGLSCRLREETRRRISPMTPLWERALEEPLSEDMPWEVIDELRQDLFRQLEMYTDFGVEEGKEDAAAAWLAPKIQEVADRLKIMAALLPKAIRKAENDGRVKRGGGRTPLCPLCHQKVKG